MPPKSKPPHPAVLKRHFRYDADTGLLFFRDRPDTDFQSGRYHASRVAAMWRSKYLGKEALSQIEGGYKRGWYAGRFWRAHQIIWLMHYGWLPEQIDHIDGDRSNNRLSNLRPADNRTNARNRKTQRNNSCGVSGVYPKDGKWAAQIVGGAGRKHLGTFARLEDAIAARKDAERREGYHPNHGRAA